MNLFLFITILLATLTAAQLSGPVGPTTSRDSKQAKKTCDITSYGATSSSDVGPALLAAWTACKTGGVVVVPPGTWKMSTWVLLNGGSGWALQLDGTIVRDTSVTTGGNMIFIEHTSDVEVFSSTGAGAIQGDGYTMHQTGSISGPRLLRFYDVTGFSVHDIKLVDSPSFHFSMDTCKNGEVYNMLIRGGDHGGLDGIDVWSDNIYIHDIMVTNKDECVTVKSPAHNILIENIYCNWSGGSALGSLGANVDISTIHYRNIYTVSSNQMMMIKSNGGSGLAADILFENFIGHSNAYSLDIDQYWSSMSPVDGPGVQLDNVTFRNWKGTAANGALRGPIRVLCADGAPCEDVRLEDFAMWTETGGKVLYTCRSAYGSGEGPVGAACLKSASGSGSVASYAASTVTVSSAPTGYSAATMAGDLKSAFGFMVSIPTPTWPSSFFPGVTPVSRLAAASPCEGRKCALG